MPDKTVTELKGEAYDLIAKIEEARAKLVEINFEISKKIGATLATPNPKPIITEPTQ
jgi:hypothetical protein